MCSCGDVCSCFQFGEGGGVKQRENVCLACRRPRYFLARIRDFSPKCTVPLEQPQCYPPPPLSFPTPGKTVPHHPLGDGHQVTVPHPPRGTTPHRTRTFAGTKIAT